MSIYGIIEYRWIQRMVGTEETADITLPARALTYMKLAQKGEADGLGGDIWPDLQLREQSADITTAFRRIRDMALAYHSSFFTKTYRNRELLQTIYKGLERMSAYYRKDMELFGNWWDYDIGGAQALMDSLILLHKDILKQERNDLIRHYMEAVHAFIPVPEHVRRPYLDDLEMTGANLADTSLVCLLRALLEQNSDELRQVQQAMDTILPYVTEDDGFYPDGSFIQHHHIPYAGGYGPDLLNSFENIVYLLADTDYSLILLKQFNHAAGWIMDSFLPFLRNVEMMDMVRGRKTSRYQEKAHDTGRFVMSTLLLLAGYLPQEKNREIRGIIKGQIERTAYEPDSLYRDLRPCQCEAVRNLFEDSLQPACQEESYRTYGYMDRVVVHRKNYSLGISMFSERTGRFSYGNGENKKGFHACEGMVYLYTNNEAHYDDDFWPTVNTMRLSGITTDHTGTELVPWKDNRNSKSWVGGSNLLNRYGTTGMEVELEQPDSDLTARKSWFVFEEGIVCLGVGITASTGDCVETIVENRRVDSDRLTMDGECITLEGSYLPVGYYVPNGQEVTVTRETGVGCWHDLNDNGSTEQTSRTFLSIAISHGPAPVKASYSYVIVPGADREKMKQLVNKTEWKILENTEQIQAAMEPSLGLMGINFWEPGCLEGIRSDSPCSVTVKRDGNRLYIGIADPTHHKSHITLLLDGLYETIRKDETIELYREAGKTGLVVSVKNSGGKTHFLYCEGVTPNFSLNKRVK